MARNRSRLKPIVLAMGSAIILALLVSWGYWRNQIAYTFSSLSSGQTEERVDFVRQSRDLPDLSPNTIRIPHLKIEAPVIKTPEKSEAAYREVMTRGVGHYPGTAQPGEFGNTHIYGHSAGPLWKGTNPYFTIFSLITKLEVGDSIYVSNAKGEVFEYRVIDSFVVDPDDLWVLDQYDYKRKILTLQTSYPLGMSLNRYIVRSEMVE